MIHFHYQCAIELNVEIKRRNNQLTEQFMLEETEIIICDEKCVSKEEAKAILKELAQKIRFCQVKKKHL